MEKEKVETDSGIVGAWRTLEKAQFTLDFLFVIWFFAGGLISLILRIPILNTPTPSYYLIGLIILAFAITVIGILLSIKEVLPYRKKKMPQTSSKPSAKPQVSYSWSYIISGIIITWIVSVAEAYIIIALKSLLISVVFLVLWVFGVTLALTYAIRDRRTDEVGFYIGCLGLVPGFIEYYVLKDEMDATGTPTNKAFVIALLSGLFILFVLGAFYAFLFSA